MSKFSIEQKEKSLLLFSTEGKHKMTIDATKYIEKGKSSSYLDKCFRPKILVKLHNYQDESFCLTIKLVKSLTVIKYWLSIRHFLVNFLVSAANSISNFLKVTVLFFKNEFSVSFEESSLQRCKFEILVEVVKSLRYTK